jgi:hypothetical protein
MNNFGGVAPEPIFREAWCLIEAAILAGLAKQEPHVRGVCLLLARPSNMRL